MKIVPQGQQVNRERRAAFSLVELMTVVGVVSILFAVATPALLSSRKASELTSAGNTMADLATLCRQTALSKNAITALILVSKTNPTTRQMATMLEYDPQIQAWKYRSGWIRLSESVEAKDSALDNDGGTDVDKLSKEALQRIAELKLKNSGTEIQEKDYTVFIFYPDGRMEGDPTKTRKIRVATGETAANGPDPINYYDLVFNADTSAFRIVRP